MTGIDLGGICFAAVVVSAAMVLAWYIVKGKFARAEQVSILDNIAKKKGYSRDGMKLLVEKGGLSMSYKPMRLSYGGKLGSTVYYFHYFKIENPWDFFTFKIKKDRKENGGEMQFSAESAVEKELAGLMGSDSDFSYFSSKACNIELQAKQYYIPIKKVLELTIQPHDYFQPHSKSGLALVMKYSPMPEIFKDGWNPASNMPLDEDYEKQLDELVAHGFALLEQAAKMARKGA